MGKEPKQTDDPELDELIRLICLFGQAPSRDYLEVIQANNCTLPGRPTASAVLHRAYPR